MGNYRFKLSDLIPNSWLHKLRQMTKTRKNPKRKNSTSPSSSEPKRKSYYFSRDDHLTKTTSSHQEPPRKSSRRRRTKMPNRRRLVSSAGATLESVYSNSLLSTPTTSTSDTFDGMVSCKCMEITKGNDKSPPCGFNIVSEKDNHRLPRIITSKQDPTKIQTTSAEFSEYGVKEDILTCNTTYKDRRYSPSYGVKLRTNSPRIMKNVAESTFAVMKSSKDPGRDFRESMVEMIVENNIRASNDLEDLLACYLSLNSTEYHDLIINVFKQIWFDFLRK